MSELRIRSEHFSHFVQILSPFFGRCSKFYSAAELHKPQVKFLVDAYPNMETHEVTILIGHDRSVVSEILSHLIKQILSHSKCDRGEVFRSEHIRHEALILFFWRQAELRCVSADNIFHSVNSVYPPLAVGQIEAFEVKPFVEVSHAHGEHISVLQVVFALLFTLIIKSSVAVALCMVIYFFRTLLPIGNGIPFYSALAALWCLQPYSNSTKNNAGQRSTGTLIGAAYGLAFIVLLRFFGLSEPILVYLFASAIIIPVI